jgi:hypothetical protein
MLGSEEMKLLLEHLSEIAWSSIPTKEEMSHPLTTGVAYGERP